MTPATAFSASDLQAFLSSALGTAKAHEVVAEALTNLGIASTTINRAAARRVLGHIAANEGLIGVSGRVALTRLEGGSSESSTGVGKKRSLEVVADLLAPTLGNERALTLVREQGRALGHGPEIDLDQALTLLERIAKFPGVTGIAARFAKTRINLTW